MRSKHNTQYMVGIPRDSAMHAFYVAEAESQGVKVPTYIYQLLKDRYEALHGTGNNIWFPRGTPSPSASSPITQSEQKEPDKVKAVLQAFGGEDED